MTPGIFSVVSALNARWAQQNENAANMSGATTLGHKRSVVAFGSFNNEFVRNLPYQASAAVAFGLPYDEAVKAVTINAAEIWGVGDQYGSIEKGKWADLMITDGDPLETRTQIKQLFIKGKQVDLANKHQKLYEKYLARP